MAAAQDYSSLSITYAPPGTTNSGTALTNAVPANTTNAVLSDPIGLTHYGSCAIQWTFSALTNSPALGCTNVLTFGVRFGGVGHELDEYLRSHGGTGDDAERGV